MPAAGKPIGMTRHAIVLAAAAGIGLILLAPAAAAAERSAAVRQLLAFEARHVKPSKAYRIAIFSECPPPASDFDDRYCAARARGLTAAAARFGFSVERFHAFFDPATQARQVADALDPAFDGYLFAPVAAAAGCEIWRRHLAPTGKPVVSLDLPMCGDADYTAGLAATVTMQRQAYYDAHVDHAFRTCIRPCNVAAVGGFAGSGLFGVWDKAIAKAAMKYPDVALLSHQPANYDARLARQITRAALSAHPEINMILSAWDDMTVGVEQALVAAGRTPGRDIRIYSMGATAEAIAKVVSGIYHATTVLLPWAEAYYAAVALIAALEGEPIDGYVNEAELPPLRACRPPRRAERDCPVPTRAVLRS